MSSEIFPQIEEYDPIKFELASGAEIKVSLCLFWSSFSELDRILGQRAYQYLAIRIYGDEDSYPRRIQKIHEFRQGRDFNQRHCSKIWEWLIRHVASYERFEHECTDDFLTLLEEIIAEIVTEDEDMLEHLERLYSNTIPDEFELIDNPIGQTSSQG